MAKEMAKVALLVGVSEYAAGLNALPGAVKDVEAMQRVLQHPSMGAFTEVIMLPNPEPMAMQEAIENLFSSCTKDDLALLFFSGHGVKDDGGRLYFATRLTRKNAKGDLVKATAVPASFVQDIMSNSRCKRQIVILDCCFSGAFAEGMTAKDGGVVDVKTQLGGEGRAVLTSSTSTQYSFEQQGADLSVYTRYIVEGIETGAADLDSNGSISIDELHEYAQKKVHEAAPAMQPKIYAMEEGFRIRLAQAPIQDPKLSYRKEVEKQASRGNFTELARRTLEAHRINFGLLLEEAEAIKTEVIKPYQERELKKGQYEQAFMQAVQQEYPLNQQTSEELKDYQKALGLRGEDVASIEQRIIQQQEAGLLTDLESDAREAVETKIVTLTSVPLLSTARPPGSTTFWSNRKHRLLVGAVASLVFGVISYVGINEVRKAAEQAEQVRLDKAILEKAKDIAKDKKGGPTMAIAEARRIPSTSPEISRATDFIKSMYNRKLETAEVYYSRDGNLDEAINVARSVANDKDADSALQEDARKKIARWDGEWKRSEASIRASGLKIQNHKMTEAEEDIKKVSGAYWLTAKATAKDLSKEGHLKTAHDKLIDWRKVFFNEVDYIHHLEDDTKIVDANRLIENYNSLIDVISEKFFRDETRKRFDEIVRPWIKDRDRYIRLRECQRDSGNCSNLIQDITAKPFQVEPFIGWAEQQKSEVNKSQPQTTLAPSNRR